MCNIPYPNKSEPEPPNGHNYEVLDDVFLVEFLIACVYGKWYKILFTSWAFGEIEDDRSKMELLCCLPRMSLVLWLV